jgi:predicted TIM-barrel fold metal-dependent hydrolase
MNPTAIYSKSGKGVQEASGKTSLLKRPDRAVLTAIDGRAMLKEVAEKAPDRASFGTDFPLFDLSYASSMWLNFVKDRPWADEDTKNKVLGGNMQRLLGL